MITICLILGVTIFIINFFIKNKNKDANIPKRFDGILLLLNEKPITKCIRRI